MILWELFLVFFRVGLFSIGGAYSFLPVIEREVVERYHWLSRQEYVDVLSIVKLVPGAISIKYATFTGYKMAGVFGAIVANIGNMLAPVLFIIFGSIFYIKYNELEPVKRAFEAIRLAIFAMIIAVAFQTVEISTLVQWKSIVLIVVSFMVFAFTSIHPGIIIIFAGLLGVVWR